MGAAAGELAPGTRHLAGKPIELGWLNEVLRVGRQPARAAAAVERCRMRPRMGLFEVRARGDRQPAELGGVRDAPAEPLPPARARSSSAGADRDRARAGCALIAIGDLQTPGGLFPAMSLVGEAARELL